MPVHFIKQKKFLPGVRNNSEREKRGAANSYVIIILVYIFGSYIVFLRYYKVDGYATVSFIITCIS